MPVTPQERDLLTGRGLRWPRSFSLRAAAEARVGGDQARADRAPLGACSCRGRRRCRCGCARREHGGTSPRAGRRGCLHNRVLRRDGEVNAPACALHAEAADPTTGRRERANCPYPSMPRVPLDLGPRGAMIRPFRAGPVCGRLPRASLRSPLRLGSGQALGYINMPLRGGRSCGHSLNGCQ